MALLPDHIGLDFGNHSVKAVQLDRLTESKPRLVNFGSQPTPNGVINSEDFAHQQKLADALKALYDSSKFRTKNVVMALPEFSVFTRFMELIGVKDEEIANTVYYQAKTYIPIPVEDVQISAMPIGKDESRGATRVLVVAAPKKIIDIYLTVVELAGLVPVAVETESVAMGRAMFKSTLNKNLLMLDFGATSTDMSVLNDGNMVFSQSISIGSDAMTQAIVNQFNFDYAQAEQYKRNYGLNQAMLEGKIYTAIKPIIDSIITEVQRGLEFYKTRTLLPIPQDCLLNGDGALLPELGKYITAALGINSQIADPWQNIEVDKKFADVLAKNKPSYSVAVGLGLKHND
jgi:type IV pilus assembly protein PilM